MGDQLYAGPVVARVMAAISPDWRFERVRRPKDQPRFTPIPKRWLVERSFAWIARKRRLARDYERYARSSLAFALLAMTRLMLRRLAKTSCP
jgi:transposase